jgi:steroid delta-isomerase-like uncharacterized protein
MIFRSPYPDSTIPEEPFSDYIFANLSQWANEPAFIDGPSGRMLTFAQVPGAARKVGSSLAQRGLKKGDVFAIYSPNLPEYAIAFHGVVMLGGIVTTANPLNTVDELAFQLNDTGAKFLLTVPLFLDKAKEAAAKSKVQEIFVFGEAPGATPFAELLKSDGQLPAVKINPREDLAVMPYSSGTVGRPKGVMLTHYNLVAVLEQCEPVITYHAGDKVLGLLPFFHVFGMQVLMNGTLRKGVTCVTMPRFDLEQFLQLIQNHGITHLYLVPPIVLALAKHPSVDKFNLSSLKHILSGAAPLDGAVQRAVASRLHVPVVQGYGMTETSLAIAGTPPDPSKVKLGASGVLIANMEGKVVDIASGAELGANEQGELLVRGPNIMRGYLNDPAATKMTIGPDDWMHTGDIVSVDDEGYIFVVDRLKELIKYKGMQVAPAELEGVLLTHPAIAEAAVIGSPDEQAGEVPKAFVVLKGQITPEALMDYVASKVAPYKKIRKVEIVEAIPKSPTGKILRRVLLEKEKEKSAMSEQENIKVVQASYEAFNAHDLDKFSQFRAADSLAEQPGAPAPFNVEQNRMFLQAYLKAIPDVHLDVTLMIAQGNYVVAHTSYTGTNTGPLPTPTGGSIPPTGKKFVLKACDTYELRGGKIFRSWSFADMASLLGQLGLLPPM